MALKYKVIRCVAYTIEIILLFILQELPYLMPSLLGVRPLLLIAAPMTIAILENEKIGLGFGVFAGLLMDMGYGSVIGFHAIVLGVLGFFIGLLAVNLVKTNALTSLLCTAAAVFAVISLHFVFFYLLRGYDMASYAYQKYYLPMMLYSFLPTPILYYFNKAFVVGVRERETI